MQAGKKRILVVDDNADSAEVIALTLARLGHDVEVAHDGASALGFVDQFSPELVFLDIGMPLMDGYEIAARVRARPVATQPCLVAMTGYGQAGDRARALESGFDAHLVKPIRFELLAKFMADLCGRVPQNQTR